MPETVGVIGALGVVAPAPLRGSPAQAGDVGLICYMLNPDGGLTTPDIVTFFEQHLAPHLNAFPGQRSVVILDNAPGHRALTNNAQLRIRTAVARRGALLIWNPPHSPDLNPIEHLWHVTLGWMEEIEFTLHLGLLGAPRPFAIGDLHTALQRARLTRNVFRDIFRRPI